MSSVALWYAISEESRAKLRQLLPRGWKPPTRDGRPWQVQGKIESLGELARIMREKPNEPLKKDEVYV